MFLLLFYNWGTPMVGFGDKIAAQVIPEWRKKYIRYGYLANILDRLPIIAHDSSDGLMESDPGKKMFRSYEMSDIHARIHAKKTNDPDMNTCKDRSGRSSGIIPSNLTKQALVCTPFKAKILVSRKHGDDIVLNIDCWRFDYGPSCSSDGPEESIFLRELNEDISIIVDFQARILCQCIDEFDMLQMYRSHLVHLDGKNTHEIKQTVVGMTSEKLERNKLLSAYEQLYKLTKYLETYMEGNKQALKKILKKHDKHSHCSNGHELFVAIEKGKVAFPIPDSPPEQAHMPTVPLFLNPAFLQRELIEPIEHQYVELRQLGDPSASRHAALTVLRGKAGLERHGHSHRDTFLFGALLGISIPLVAYSFAVVIAERDIYNSPLWPVGWVYFRLAFLVTLQLALAALDLYLFERLRINHALIFDLHPASLLRFPAALLAAAACFLVSFSAFTLFVAGLADPAAPQLPVFAWVVRPDPFFWPKALAAALAAAALAPLPVAGWRTRSWLLRQLARMALVPFRPVDWPMFFLADQLCSHVRTLHDLLLIGCLAAAGGGGPEGDAEPWRRAADACMAPAVLRGIALVSGLLPPGIRVVQCARRYRDMRRAAAPGAHNPHLLNGLKYALSMLVVGAAVAGPLELWVVLAAAATAVATYWDTVQDWGLGDAGRAGLRAGLLARPPVVGRGVYYWAVGANAVMRCAWALSISPGALGIALPRDVLALVLAAVELARRAQWNVLRLEWEQHHNTGEWRAVKDVHLELSESVLTHPSALIATTCAELRRRAAGMHPPAFAGRLRRYSKCFTGSSGSGAHGRGEEASAPMLHCVECEVDRHVGTCQPCGGNCACEGGEIGHGEGHGGGLDTRAHSLGGAGGRLWAALLGIHPHAA
jgi:hypothetical protein